MVRIVRVRGKKRYTRCLEPPQRLEAGCVAAADTLARSAAAGIHAYRELEDRSALSKRDGAIRDAFANAFVGASVTAVGTLVAPFAFVNGLAGGRAFCKLDRLPVPPPFNFFT